MNFHVTITGLKSQDIYKLWWSRKNLIHFRSVNLYYGVSLTLSPLAVNIEDRWWPMQTIWIQMKPHKMWGFIWDPNCLTFRLFSAKHLGGNNDFLHLLKERNIWKNYPACKELRLKLLITKPQYGFLHSFEPDKSPCDLAFDMYLIDLQL